MIWQLKLTSAYPAIVQDSRQPQHNYQQLYHAFYQQPIHNQEGLDEDIRWTHLEEEEEASKEADLKAEGSAVGLFEEAAAGETKEMEIKVKMVLI